MRKVIRSSERMTPMAKPRGCRTCFVELEEIALADGSTVLFCAACDTMADIRHHAGGQRAWPAGMMRKPLKLVVNRPRTAIVKKVSVEGKKSLTA
jgi:hypothetical protein